MLQVLYCMINVSNTRKCVRVSTISSVTTTSRSCSGWFSLHWVWNYEKWKWLEQQTQQPCSYTLTGLLSSSCTELQWFPFNGKPSAVLLPLNPTTCNLVSMSNANNNNNHLFSTLQQLVPTGRKKIYSAAWLPCSSPTQVESSCSVIASNQVAQCGITLEERGHDRSLSAQTRG